MRPRAEISLRAYLIAALIVVPFWTAIILLIIKG